jgi:hypothetical protein
MVDLYSMCRGVQFILPRCGIGWGRRCVFNFEESVHTATIQRYGSLRDVSGRAPVQKMNKAVGRSKSFRFITDRETLIYWSIARDCDAHGPD